MEPNQELPPDLRLPLLPDTLDEMSRAMEQQAVVAKTGTAMGGHSDPFFFFGKIAAALKIAASQIRKDNPPAPPEPAPAPESKVAPVPPPAEKKTRPAPAG